MERLLVSFSKMVRRDESRGYDCVGLYRHNDIDRLLFRILVMLSNQFAGVHGS
jgi:hypothetical protein